MPQRNNEPKRIAVSPHRRRVRVGPRNNWHYETRQIRETSRPPTEPYDTQPNSKGRNSHMSTPRPYPDTNQVAIVGKLTNDPNLKTVGDKQTPVAELTVHVNNGTGRPTLIDIQIWAGGANAAHKYLNEGDQIVVTGKLRTDQYTNRDGEQTRIYIDAGTNGVQFTSQRTGTNKPEATA